MLVRRNNKLRLNNRSDEVTEEVRPEGAENCEKDDKSQTKVGGGYGYQLAQFC